MLAFYYSNQENPASQKYDIIERYAKGYKVEIVKYLKRVFADFLKDTLSSCVSTFKLPLRILAVVVWDGSSLCF